MQPDGRPFRIASRDEALWGGRERRGEEEASRERAKRSPSFLGPVSLRAGHSPSALAFAYRRRVRGVGRSSSSRCSAAMTLGGERQRRARCAQPRSARHPEIGRSAAADALANKTWDDMSADERTACRARSETRVRQRATFRASNGFVVAVDVFSRGRRNHGSAHCIPRSRRQEAKERRRRRRCSDCTERTARCRRYRYFTSSSQSDFYEARAGPVHPVMERRDVGHGSGPAQATSDSATRTVSACTVWSSD